jgi:hypothetical protein
MKRKSVYDLDPPRYEHHEMGRDANVLTFAMIFLLLGFGIISIH